MIYSQTREVAHALRDEICDLLEKSTSKHAAGDLHLIGVGEDSADEEYDAPRRRK